MPPEQPAANGPTADVQDTEEPLLGQRRTSAGEIVEPAGSSLVGWVALTVFTQFLWGLYPVASRYLETVPRHPLPPFRLITFVNTVACVVLFLVYSAPRALRRRLHAPKAAQNGAVRPQVSLGEMVGSVAIMGLSVSCLAAGMICGSNLTTAYLVLLVFMSAPLMVAPLSYAVLGSPLSPLLWPTIAATLLGGGVAVYGGLQGGADVRMGPRDFAGMGLALLGTAGQAVFVVFVQKTSDFISNEVVLYINYAAMLAFAPITSLIIEKQAWTDILHYNALELGNFAYLSVGVYVFSNLLQQLCVRRLGAPVFAVFICTRLIASILGSWLLLGERIRNATEAAGCVIIVLAVTGYLTAKAIGQLRSGKGSPS